jgi:hypothetical protein
MIDPVTKKPLTVKVDGNSVPYIMLPMLQLDEVCAMLDANGFTYWVDRYAISYNNKPEVTVITLATGSDVVAAQKLLDNSED